jgi:hypothetical protein
MHGIGRVLIVVGIALAVVGVLFVALERMGLGRLPGDLMWQRKGIRVYVPIATSILLSLVLTVVLNLLLRRK